MTDVMSTLLFCAGHAFGDINQGIVGTRAIGLICPAARLMARTIRVPRTSCVGSAQARNSCAAMVVDAP
jgi:hypothetical protein